MEDVSRIGRESEITTQEPEQWGLEENERGSVRLLFFKGGLPSSRKRHSGGRVDD